MTTFPDRRRFGRGFTLVELLVVIGIIAVLIGILMPALRKAREQALVTQCASNLHQWAVGLQTYAAAHKGYFPVNIWTHPKTGEIHGGRDTSWVGKGVIQFQQEYLVSLGGFQNNAAIGNESHTSFCPTQDWHRVAPSVVGNPGYETELLGYFYLPYRSIADQPGNDYKPAGEGWVAKKKFAGEFKYAPIMSDMIQGYPGGPDGYTWGGSGAPFPSHLDKRAKWSMRNPRTNAFMPPVYGANFLFEDGHVTWHSKDGIDVGARIGNWECFYKIPIK